MRKNQKGFTLVELIIAIAILAIVTLAVCGFIVVGSRSYTSANTDIMLQQEAQLALNQISDVIIDTTESINYGSGTEMVLKDSEFSSEPDEKDLVVINSHDGLSPTDSSLQNNNLCYQFEWRKDTETIYFRDSEATITESHPKPDEAEWNDWAILAQHVKELHIDISQFEENRVVMVSMTFENGNREYSTSNNVTVRNRVAINKIDVDPMKKAEDFTITTVKSIILEPGDVFNLNDKTEVNTSSGDNAVVWELVDPGTTTSTLSSDGQLSIGTGETRDSFLVRVRRLNEEYASQNDKVAKTVKVNVKRVKSVDLSCSDTSIRSGSTVTVSGSASGYMLGASCDAHSCLADDESKDHELTPSRWRIVRGPATIETSDEGSAEVKIASSAKAGDEIEIEATSDLSVRKSYGVVTGTLVIKVAKGTVGDIPLKSGFKFGTDNDPGPLDYMRSHLPTDYFQYVICVRVRELNSTNALDDQVVMYHSTGANERFFPDLFGLDLTRSYYVFFQVLDPVSIETRQKKANGEIGGYYEDPRDVIVQEYLNNIDPITGKYVGDKYNADALYYGTLNPPAITVGYNGVVYPNDNEDYYETYSFITGGETVMGRPWLGEVINVDHNVIYNSIKFTVYKGEGDDPAGWERVYGFDGNTLQYDTGSNRTKGGSIMVEPNSSQFLKRDINKNDKLMEDSGTYHIVPGFVYANNPNVREYDYMYKSPNLHGDYNTYYYEQPQCTITMKIGMGFNLELPRENGQEQWTNFPVPTDNDFPFALKSSKEQEISRNFGVYLSSGNKVKDLWNVTVKCSYLPGAMGSRDAYTIELYSEETRGNVTIKNNYGTYKCEVGGDKWNIVTAGTTIEESTWRARIYFDRWGEKWMMEVPLPSDDDFPNISGTGTEDQGNKVCYKVSDKYGEETWNRIDGSLIYTKSGDTYTVELRESWGANLGTWTCTSTGTEWIKQ